MSGRTPSPLRDTTASNEKKERAAANPIVSDKRGWCRTVADVRELKPDRGKELVNRLPCPLSFICKSDIASASVGWETAEAESHMAVTTGKGIVTEKTLPATVAEPTTLAEMRKLGIAELVDGEGTAAV